MPVQSGSISMSYIRTQIGGGAAPDSLSEYWRNGSAGVNSKYPNVNVQPGTIRMSDFYRFDFTIANGTQNANLRTLAVAAGWNQSCLVWATIGSGSIVSSTSNGTPALTIDGSFPKGVVLMNQGWIVGKGGKGTDGDGGTNPSGSGGNAGGVALSVSVPVTIDNTGTIGGGGGGGGNSGNYGNPYGDIGGSGGAGYGDGGYRTFWTPPGDNGTYQGGTAVASTHNAAGTTRTWTNNVPYYVNGSVTQRPPPGIGGTLGVAGGNAASAYSYNPKPASWTLFLAAPNRATAAGACTSGNANITWFATGTRLGTLG